MPKIINLSMPRTATQSFHKFATQKGFSSKHFISKKEELLFSTMNIKEIQGHYLTNIKLFECISDTPIPLFLKQIIKKNQEQKFLFVERSPESWADSIIKNQTKAKSKSGYFLLDQITYNKFLGKEKTINALEKKDYILIYENYLKYLKEVAVKSSVDLVTLNLKDSLSVPMNSLLDSVKSTRFIHFPNEDYLRGY
jgi:hypothetical protein